MAAHPATKVKPRVSRRVLIGLGIVGLFLVLGVWVALWFSSHSTAGLEGTWRDPNNPKHQYEFGPTGVMKAWVGSKSWYNRLGWEATWKRSGNRITIRTDLNWYFVGELDGDTITGKMILTNPDGELDMVLKRVTDAPDLN